MLEDYSNKFGGKSAGLARLQFLGIRVPKGKVIPHQILQSLDFSSQEKVQQSELFNEMRAFALPLWESGQSIILRSSASVEDSGSSSFAGQFESSDAIKDEDGLLKGLLSVYQGFGEDRTVVYQKRFTKDQHQFEMNIIIQEFIEPEISGVIFGCNPINGDADVVQLSWVEGFGGKLVDGSDSGETVLIDKLSSQPVLGQVPSISSVKKFLKNITGTIARLEDDAQAFFPDVEFAFSKKGELIYVQWRPVTTVLRIQPEKANGLPFGRELLGEWLGSPVSHLFQTLFFPILFAQSVKSLKEQVGYNIQYPYHLVNNGFVYLRQELNTSLLVAIVKAPFFIAKGVTFWTQTVKSVSQVLGNNNLQPSTSDATTLITEIEEMVLHNCRIISASIVTAPVAIGLEALLRVLYSWFCQSKNSLDYLSLISQGNSQSLQAKTQLSKIGKALKISDEFKKNQEQYKDGSWKLSDISDPNVVTLVDTYLDTYGHLAESFDISARTVREQSYWIDNAILMADDEQHSNETHASKTSGFKLKPVWFLLTPILKPIINRCAHIVSKYQVIRDDRAFYAQLGWDKIRLRLDILAGKLKQKGLIHRNDQIYDIDWNEIKSFFLEKKEITPLSRNDEKNLSGVPQLSINSNRFIKWLRKKIWYSKKDVFDDGVLVGHPGSPGKQNGRAVIVDNLEELNKVKRGDILICHATTPAWTTVFGLLSGIITETGNPLCHAAIVAREYGIPCVVGVDQVRHRLQTGQSIEIDGTKGVISLK